MRLSTILMMLLSTFLVITSIVVFFFLKSIFIKIGFGFFLLIFLYVGIEFGLFQLLIGIANTRDKNIQDEDIYKKDKKSLFKASNDNPTLRWLKEINVANKNGASKTKTVDHSHSTDVFRS